MTSLKVSSRAICLYMTRVHDENEWSLELISVMLMVPQVKGSGSGLTLAVGRGLASCVDMRIVQQRQDMRIVQHRQ